jgi:hypothetical protein
VFEILSIAKLGIGILSDMSICNLASTFFVDKRIYLGINIFFKKAWGPCVFCYYDSNNSKKSNSNAQN